MNLVVRADAGSAIGVGHLMRMIALGQCWKRKAGDVLFVTNCENRRLLDRLADEGFGVLRIAFPYPAKLDLELTLDATRRDPNCWCVVDGYHFDEIYFSAIKSGGSKLMIVDDTASRTYFDSDAILNQNIGAERFPYNAPSDTLLLLGTEYALLRDEFTAELSNKNVSAPAKRLLVTFGGSDPTDQTLKTVEAISTLSLRELSVKIVFGAENRGLAEARAAIAASGARIEMIAATDRMAELMSWADIAVSAAGSTCWEMAAIGLPAILITTAENQNGIARGLANAGFAIDLGWHMSVSVEAIATNIAALLDDEGARASMSAAGNSLIDGLGRDRVVRALLARS